MPCVAVIQLPVVLRRHQHPPSSSLQSPPRAAQTPCAPEPSPPPAAAAQLQLLLSTLSPCMRATRSLAPRSKQPAPSNSSRAGRRAVRRPQTCPPTDLQLGDIKLLLCRHRNFCRLLLRLLLDEHHHLRDGLGDLRGGVERRQWQAKRRSTAAAAASVGRALPAWHPNHAPQRSHEARTQPSRERPSARSSGLGCGRWAGSQRAQWPGAIAVTAAITDHR